MHGLVVRAFQAFVSDIYGPTQWREVARIAEHRLGGLCPVSACEADVFDDIVDACARVAEQPRPDLLEDLGTYLVTHRNMSTIRRLLRFGGVDFRDFLHSLDDLPERARLAVDDLVLPRIEVHEEAGDRFEIRCESEPKDFDHLLLGCLRAMADDYGALVLIDEGYEKGVLVLTLVNDSHTAGNAFQLADAG